MVLNISPESEDAVDYQFKSISEAYGKPFEMFTQVQYDNSKEYIAYIVSGMKMPLDEIKSVYERYKAESLKIDKNADEFFTSVKDMVALEVDKKFDMIKEVNTGMSVADFLDED